MKSTQTGETKDLRENFSRGKSSDEEIEWMMQPAELNLQKELGYPLQEMLQIFTKLSSSISSLN